MTRVPQDRKETKVRKAIRVMLVRKEQPAHKVQQVLRELRAIQVKLVQQEVKG